MDDDTLQSDFAPDGLRFAPPIPTRGMIRTALMRWLGRKGIGPGRAGSLSGPERLRDALQAAFDTLPAIDAGTAREFGWNLVPSQVDQAMVAAAMNAIRAESRGRQKLPPSAIQGIGMQAALAAALSAGIVSPDSVNEAQRQAMDEPKKRGLLRDPSGPSGRARPDLDEYIPGNA